MVTTGGRAGYYGPTSSRRGRVVNDLRFCHRCGGWLALTTVHDKVRPTCPSCGHVVFLDPKLAVIVLVSMDDGLVLVKRDIEPALGRWSFPAGYVDRGETVEEAAVREVREETGLEVGLSGLVGLYSDRDSPVVMAVYSAEVVGGELIAGPETRGARVYPPDALPDMPFQHDEQIMIDWQATRS